MKKFLLKKVMISGRKIVLYGFALLMFMTATVIFFLQNRTLKADLQLAQQQAFISQIDFKGQNTAPVSLSEMPASMQMEVAKLLPKTAFLSKK